MNACSASYGISPMHATFGHETPKRGVAAHAIGDFIVWIIPVVTTVPRGDEHEHALAGDLRCHPAKRVEHLRVVVEHVPRVVHAVERRHHRDASHPVWDI